MQHTAFTQIIPQFHQTFALNFTQNKAPFWQDHAIQYSVKTKHHRSQQQRSLQITRSSLLAPIMMRNQYFMRRSLSFQMYRRSTFNSAANKEATVGKPFDFFVIRHRNESKIATVNEMAKCLLSDSLSRSYFKKSHSIPQDNAVFFIKLWQQIPSRNRKYKNILLKLLILLSEFFSTFVISFEKFDSLENLKSKLLSFYIISLIEISIIKFIYLLSWFIMIYNKTINCLLFEKRISYFKWLFKWLEFVQYINVLIRKNLY